MSLLAGVLGVLGCGVLPQDSAFCLIRFSMAFIRLMRVLQGMLDHEATVPGSS